jgi:hypothetical protein
MHSEENIERVPSISRIWSDAKDVHVCHYIIYVDDRGLAYIDPEFRFPVDAETLRDAYLKTLLISDGEVLYAPASMSENEGLVVISYAKVDEDTEAIVLATVRSYSAIPIVVEPLLTSLSIGNKTLTPAFASDTLAYAVTTSDANNIVSAVASPEDAVITATLNTIPVADLTSGLVWDNGENTLVITVSKGEESTVYTITVTKEVAPNPILTSLGLGTETLVPAFSSAVTEYAVTTTETSELLTFVASPLEATVAVTLNSVPVAANNLDNPLVLTAGPDIIAITVTEGLVDKTYTITVTQGE